MQGTPRPDGFHEDAARQVCKAQGFYTYRSDRPDTGGAGGPLDEAAEPCERGDQDSNSDGVEDLQVFHGRPQAVSQ